MACRRRSAPRRSNCSTRGLPTFARPPPAGPRRRRATPRRHEEDCRWPATPGCSDCSRRCSTRARRRTRCNPRHPTYRQFYRNHLKVLTEVHAGLLEKDEAVRTAEARRDLGWDPPADTYDAAGFLSGCNPIAAKHQKLDDQQRKESAQLYTDAALKLLRDAVSKGYKDVAHIKKDPDLDPLRQRDDFQKLIAELEGKGK